MREYFRPYSLAIELSNATASGITLVDSGGTPLKCNYIAVECSSAGTDEFFRVAIDPGDRTARSGVTSGITTGVGQSFTAAASLGYDLSAAVCGYADIDEGAVVEFLLSDHDRASNITIQQSDSVVGRYFITYGQVQTGNPLRDGERPIGN